MSGEDNIGNSNIGKKIRERLEGHPSPVSDRVWEAIQAAMPVPPLPEGLPPQSPPVSPFLNGLVKMMYVVSTASLLTTSLFVIPQLAIFREDTQPATAYTSPTHSSDVTDPAHTASQPLPSSGTLPGNSSANRVNAETNSVHTQTLPDASGQDASAFPPQRQSGPSSSRGAGKGEAVRTAENQRESDTSPTLMPDHQPVTKITEERPKPDSRISVNPIQSAPTVSEGENLERIAPFNGNTQPGSLTEKRKVTTQNSNGATKDLTSLVGPDKSTVQPNAQSVSSNPALVNAAISRIAPLKSRTLTAPVTNTDIPTATVQPLSGSIQPVRKPFTVNRWSVDLLIHGITTLRSRPAPNSPMGRAPGRDLKDNLTLSGSLRLNYNLSRNIQISTGLGFYQFSWQNNYAQEVVRRDSVMHFIYDWHHIPGRPGGPVYTVVDTVWRVMIRREKATLSERSRASYVGIPVAISLRGSHGRLGYFVSLGAQLNFLVDSRRSFYLEGSPYPSTSGNGEVVRSFVPMLTTSAGISYAFSRNVSLLLEPRAAYTVTSVYQSSYLNRSYWVLGLTTGIRVAF